MHVQAFAQSVQGSKFYRQANVRKCTAKGALGNFHLAHDALNISNVHSVEVERAIRTVVREQLCYSEPPSRSCSTEGV